MGSDLVANRNSNIPKIEQDMGGTTNPRSTGYIHAGPKREGHVPLVGSSAGLN